MRAFRLAGSVFGLSVLAACQAASAPAGSVPRFALMPVAEAPAAVVPAGQPALGASVTVDLGAWFDKLRTRRVLAVVDDIERLVVTLVAADGQVYTQTVERAAIAAGQIRVTFTNLAIGAVNLRVVAEDAAGNPLTQADQTFTVDAGPNPPVAIQVPLQGVVGSGASGGGSQVAPSPSPFGPTGLDVTVQAHDGYASTQVPVTTSFTGLSTTDGRTPMAGVNFEAAFAPEGDAWLLRNATEFYSYFRWDVSPGPVYDQGTGQLLRLSPSGALLELKDGINARGLSVDGAGDLWLAVWPRELRKLAADGTSLGSWTLPANVPYRGLLCDGAQVWVANGSSVTRYTPAGAVAGTTLLPGPTGAFAQDRATGAVWALAGNRVVKLAANGAVKATSAPIDAFAENPYTRLAVGPDGSVWVTLHQEQRILRLKPDGSAAATGTLEGAPLDVQVTATGEAWVSTQSGLQNTGNTSPVSEIYYRKRLLRVGADGTILEARQPLDPGIVLRFDTAGALWSVGGHVTRFTP